MATELDLDVLVIGGGPVGLFAAHELCRYGVSPKRIRIIDKRAKQMLWAKATGVQSRSQELFYASSEELSNDIQSNALKLQKMFFARYPPDCMKSDKSFSDNETTLNVDVSALQSQFNHILLIEQYNTENLIAKDLKEKYDVSLERGIELIDFQDKGSYVEVKLAPYKGSKNEKEEDDKEDEQKQDGVQVLRVGYLVGCDGARSFVRSKLNLPFVGETYDERFVLFHGELGNTEGMPWPTTFVVNGVNGMLFVMTMADKTWIIVADLNDDQQAEMNKRHGGKMEKPTEADIEWLCKQRGMNGVTVQSTRWLSAFFIQSRQISQYSKGRVYLAGDACHIHSPLGGQGMNMGFQDSANLAWKLAMVIKKRCSASLLVSYNAERYSVDQVVLKLVDTATKGAMSRDKLSLAVGKALQNGISQFQWLIDAQIQQMGQIGYSYKDVSKLSFEYWKPPSLFPYVLYRRQQNITRLVRRRLCAGDRCPDFVIPSENEKQFEYMKLYELFRDSNDKPFVVLLFEGNPDPYWRVPFSDYRDLTVFKRQIENSACGAYCKVIIVPSVYERINQMYGVYQQCMFLIRPDQYIGLRSQPLSMDALKYYLTKKLYITDIRIGDNEAERVKNMERIDPIPSILLTGLLLGVTYVVGNALLPGKYKPSHLVNSAFAAMRGAFSG